MSETLKEMLIRHEDERFYPYTDSVGKLTIGVGHNLDAKGISKTVSRLMLKEDIDDAIEDTLKWIPENVYYTITEARRMVIINMMFQMGLTRMKGFKKMRAALLNWDYMEAARQMEDSKWYRQVPRRASELVQIMRDGVLLR